MGVEATIDGKRCLFTADNFFHQDMFSGSGGWMGLNRSFPRPMRQAPRRCWRPRPIGCWLEHGGLPEFNAPKISAAASAGAKPVPWPTPFRPRGINADWDPSAIAVEPLLVHKAAARPLLRLTLVVQMLLPMGAN